MAWLSSHVCPVCVKLPNTEATAKRSECCAAAAAAAVYAALQFSACFESQHSIFFFQQLRTAPAAKAATDSVCVCLSAVLKLKLREEECTRAFFLANTHDVF